MSVILQSCLPPTSVAMLQNAKLPGVSALQPEDFLQIDDAYGAQMAERDRLIAELPDKVHALSPQALLAAQELLRTVLQDLEARDGFCVTDQDVQRPDGTKVCLDFDRPLLCLGRLVQEDFCLLQKLGDEHVLTGAILCFPASWTLSEKFMQPLLRIHRPVADYDGNLAKRVQRLFDGVQPDRPLWRVNGMVYDDPTLFSPRKEKGTQRIPSAQSGYFRSERQSISRLPDSRAVVFSIHSTMVLISGISLENQKKLGLVKGEATADG